MSVVMYVRSRSRQKEMLRIQLLRRYLSSTLNCLSEKSKGARHISGRPIRLVIFCYLKYLSAVYSAEVNTKPNDIIHLSILIDVMYIPCPNNRNLIFKQDFIKKCNIIADIRGC